LRAFVFIWIFLVIAGGWSIVHKQPAPARYVATHRLPANHRIVPSDVSLADILWQRILDPSASGSTNSIGRYAAGVISERGILDDKKTLDQPKLTAPKHSFLFWIPLASNTYDQPDQIDAETQVDICVRAASKPECIDDLHVAAVECDQASPQKCTIGLWAPTSKRNEVLAALDTTGGTSSKSLLHLFVHHVGNGGA
jgi:hypothetical protein